MLLPIDMKFAARKVHFLQNEGPMFDPVWNFTVPLPCVQANPPNLPIKFTHQFLPHAFLLAAGRC